MSRRASLVWAVPIAVMLARIAYAVFSPYEIVGDEAQHWEWSRHLDWAYFEKGPGIAWIVAAATHLFGPSLWAIRLPAAVCGAVTMIAVAQLARDGDSKRPDDVALASIVLLALVPAFQLPFILITTDAPSLAGWAVAAWAGWRAMRGELRHHPSRAAWVVTGCAIGATLLVNYAAVMLLVSLAGFLWTIRSRIDQRGALRRYVAATAVALLWLIPVAAWNLEHQGAGFGQVLGYVRLPGGIWPARPVWTFQPGWTVVYIAGTIGIIGPAVALMWIGARRVRDQARWMRWCAMPLLAVFLVVSFRARIEGNWPVPAFLTLVPLAAAAVVEGWPDRRVVRWSRATVAFGVLAAVLVHAPFLTARLPLAGRLVPVARFSGMEAAVREMSPAVKEFRRQHGDRGLLVSSSHNDAGRISFYLDGNPVVRSAGRYFGGRPSSYDIFPDTALTPELHDRPALLFGETPEHWRSAFDIEGLEALDAPSVWRAARFSVRPKQEASCGDCVSSR